MNGLRDLLVVDLDREILGVPRGVPAVGHGYPTPDRHGRQRFGEPRQERRLDEPDVLEAKQRHRLAARSAVRGPRLPNPRVAWG